MKVILILILFVYAFNPASYGQDYIFVFLNNKPDKALISDDESEALQKTHMANIERMVADGQMIVAGPFEGGGGIFILKTDDLNEARNWLNSDPAIKAKRWDIELFPITFLRGGACLASEPYEMVVYNFARVNLINEIANFKSGNNTASNWSDNMEYKGVLAVGTFPKSDGGVIIYDDNIEASLLNIDHQDQIQLDFKKVWVAKGSFCEKR